MIILHSGISNDEQWWAGHYECYSCTARFELDKEDKNYTSRQTEGSAEFGWYVSRIVHCPECGNKWRHSKVHIRTNTLIKNIWTGDLE